MRCELLSPYGSDRIVCSVASRRRDHSVADKGVISAVCVRFMFGKTSLALV